MAALAGGVGALVLGVIGIIVWFGDFLDLLKGGVPLMLILGGALAAYLGFEEIKDKRSAEKFEEPPADLKKEVETLKEEIKGLKEEKKTPALEKDKTKKD
jgi:hypothetical protein